MDKKEIKERIRYLQKEVKILKKWWDMKGYWENDIIYDKNFNDNYNEMDYLVGVLLN